VLAFTWVLARVLRASTKGLWQRSVDLLVWIVVVLQVLAQAGRTARPGLPPVIASLLRALAAFQLEDVALPAACWSTYPFTSEVLVMVTSLAASLGLAVWAVVLTRSVRSQASRSRPCSKDASRSAPDRAASWWAPRLTRLAGKARNAVWRSGPTLGFTLCTLLYSLTCNIVFKLLDCSTVPLSTAAWHALDKDDSALSLAGDSSDPGQPTGTVASTATVAAWVLRSNDSFACFQGSHRPAAALAIVTLALYVLPYPLWTWLWAERRIASFVAAHYKPWHIRVAVVLPSVTRNPLLKGEPRLSTGSGDSVLTTLGSVATLGKPADGPATWQAVLQLDHRARAEYQAGAGQCEYACSTITCGRQTAIGRRRAHTSPVVPAVTTPAPPTAGSVQVGAQGPRAELCAVPGLLAAAARDANPDLAVHAPLAHFAGGSYRPSLFYTRQLDMLSLSALAALQVFWPQPDTQGAAAGRAVAMCAILLSMAWYIGSRNPFYPEGRWQLYVKVGSLLLAALTVALTHFCIIVNLRYGAGADPSDDGYARDTAALAGLSYALLVGCITLALTLAVGFWTHTITGARRLQLSMVISKAKQADAARRGKVIPSLGPGAQGPTRSALSPQLQQALGYKADSVGAGARSRVRVRAGAPQQTQDAKQAVLPGPSLSEQPRGIRAERVSLLPVAQQAPSSSVDDTALQPSPQHGSRDGSFGFAAARSFRKLSTSDTGDAVPGARRAPRAARGSSETIRFAPQGLPVGMAGSTRNISSRLMRT
jgi:hypothetical protein